MSEDHRGRTSQFARGIKQLLVFLPMATGLSLWIMTTVLVFHFMGPGILGLIGVLIGVVVGAPLVLGGAHGSMLLVNRWDME